MRATLRPRALLFAAAALAAGAAHARAQSIPIGVGGSLSSNVGTPIDAPLVADMTARSERLGAFTARVTWDPAVLRLDATIPGDFGGATVAVDSIAQGILRVAGANAGGYTGVIILGTLRFMPIGGGTSNINLTVSELIAAASFADLLPSAVVSNGSFCTAAGLYGDMNQDAAVTSADALIAVTHAVGLPTGTAIISLGDVDADGATGTRDALGILSHVVGLPTPGFRILQQAGGACTTNPPLTIAILPGAPGALLAGQTIQLQARVTDPSGVPQSASGVIWKTDNAAAVTVDSVGRASAVAAGSATIWAIRDALDSAQLALTVAAARTRHVVDAAAAGAVNQLGTAALPFGDLTRAATAAAAGDTVDIQPGVYDGATFNRAVTLLGHSAGPNGVVVRGSGGIYGLYLTGLGVFEVHDVAIEGFNTGLIVNSVDTIIVDSLRVLARYPGGTCPNAGVQFFEAWRVEVRRSQLTGEGNGTSGCAEGIRVDGNVRTFVMDRTTITDFGGSGFYAGGGGGGIDSLLVTRSRVTDNSDYGLYVYNYGYASGRIPPTTSMALVVDSSRVERNQYEAVYGDYLRSALIMHSVVDSRLTGNDALNLYGNYQSPGFVRLVADSLLGNDDYWFYGYDLDSLVVDSLRVSGFYAGDMDGVDHVRATNSSFVEMTSGYAFNLYTNSGTTGTVDMDSVTFRGAASCGQCADLLYASDYRGTFTRLRVDNFGTGLYLGDSAVSVTNSVFTNGSDGIYTSSYSAAPQTLLVRHVQFTDVYTPINDNDHAATVDTVTITRAESGIQLYGAGADTVRAVTVTDVNDYAVDAEDAAAYVADNTIVRGGYSGLYVYGPSAGVAGDSLIIVNNSVECLSSGSYGILAYYLDARIQGNTVSGGCDYGIEVYGDTAHTATIRGNTVVMSPTNGSAGIRVEHGGMRARVVGNTVTGSGLNGAEGAIRIGHQNGPSYRTRFALVDSNTVQGANNWGIRAEYADSIEVRGNLLEDVASPYYYAASDRGAIGLANVTTQALVVGNTVRRARGRGIALDQQLNYYDPLDTATFFVDSNAVSGSDTAAVFVDNGLLSMSHNNIRNNTRDGVFFNTTQGGALHDNAFQGNAVLGNGANPTYAVNNCADGSVDATGNWWGVDGQQPGTPGTDSTCVAFDNTPLASAPTNLPPLAPPAMRPLAAMTALSGGGALLTAGGTTTASRPPRVSAAEELAEREARLRARVERAATRAAARTTAPAGGQAAARAPHEAVPAQAFEHLQLRARLEAQRAAERAARDSVRAEVRARTTRRAP